MGAGAVLGLIRVQSSCTMLDGENSDRAWDKIQLLPVTQDCSPDKAWSLKELSQLVFDPVWKNKDGAVE